MTVLKYFDKHIAKPYINIADKIRGRGLPWLSFETSGANIFDEIQILFLYNKWTKLSLFFSREMCNCIQNCNIIFAPSRF